MSRKQSWLLMSFANGEILAGELGGWCHATDLNYYGLFKTILIPFFDIYILTGPFLACIRHSCLLCQLCFEHCFETVCMRLKVAQSIFIG